MPNVQLNYDGEVILSVGKSRNETNWKNKSVPWSWFVNKVSVTHRTHETVAEYARDTRARQDEIKDVGGFVGGYISGGNRRNGSIVSRQLVTLDLDFATMGFWDDWELLNGNAACIYSTHKHTPGNVRLRLIIPLNREVTCDEYEAIARRIAGDLGIDMFDDTTYQPTRLMYWPSTSRDGEYVWKYCDGPWLDADALLATYRDWRDASQWPVSSRVDSAVHREIRKQENPLEKDGIVGAFCRTYTIPEAIEQFIPDVYDACDCDNRYTFKAGSTYAGMVVYDDLFAYSHHGTDPCSGKLVNAFDLIRIHLFHLRDEDFRGDKTVTANLPSYEAMVKLAGDDKQVKKLIIAEKAARVADDFKEFLDGPLDESGIADQLEHYNPITYKQNGKASNNNINTDFDSGNSAINNSDNSPSNVDTTPSNQSKTGENQSQNTEFEGGGERESTGLVRSSEPTTDPDTDPEAWREKIDVTKKGEVRSTIHNVSLIILNDPVLAGKLGLNSFEHREMVLGKLPWRSPNNTEKYMTDTDDSGIRNYLERAYNITGSAKIDDGVRLALEQNSFHPIRNYLNGLKWDGKSRIDTLLVDYLGADDSEYVRSVTRKTFTAAVARVMNPGVKFDYMLVLVGPQGVGKSTLMKKLGREWFSDSFITVQGKEAYEQVQGVWIIEVAELSGLKKAEIESVKHFISKQEDRFRAAYGRRIETHKRQCIFIGTTNEDFFLKDYTGNRRFWPVDIGKLFDPEDALSDEVLLEGLKITGPEHKNVFDDLTDAVVNQIWAEAVSLYKGGEAIFLDKETEKLANEVQSSHAEVDDRTGVIQAYLDTPIPDNWYKTEIFDRKNYFLQEDLIREKGDRFRQRVSVAEIWCECMRRDLADMSRFNTDSIHKMMSTMKGWIRSSNPVEIPGYGRQRCYYRDAFPKDYNIIENDKIKSKH